MNNGGLQKSLNILLRKPTKLKDCSFPAQDHVILRNSYLYWIGGSLAFFLIFLALFADVWASTVRSLVGRGEIESWLWRFSWWKQLSAEAWHQGIGQTIACFFSAGATPGVGSILDFALFSWPLEKVLGPTSYYNAKVFIFMALNCGACWYALTKIWGEKLYAWLGSFVYSINGYTLYEISQGRCRSLILFTIPLCLLKVLATVKSQNNNADQKCAWLWAALWLGLTWAFNPGYGLVLIIVILAIMVWAWSQRASGISSSWALRRCGGALALGLALYLPWAGSYLVAWGQGRLEAVVGHELTWGVSLPKATDMQKAPIVTPASADYLTAQKAGTTVGTTDGTTVLRCDYARKLWHNSLPINALFNASAQYALPLFLLVLVILPYRWNWHMPWLWLILGGVFLVLCWGPYPSNSTDGSAGNLTIIGDWYLPFAWLYRWCPGASLLTPSHLLPFLFLALAILAIIRLEQIASGRLWIAQLLVMGVVGTQLTQFYHSSLLPLPTTRIDVAPIYYFLGDTPARGLIEVPWAGAYLDLGQQVHRCPTLGGEATRWYPACLSLHDDSEVSRWSLAILPLDNTFCTHLLAHQLNSDKWETCLDSDRQKLIDQGYSWVILHERSCNILAGNRGEILYFDYFKHLKKLLGTPLVNSYEPVYTDMPGCRAVDVGNPVWYRVAVFSLAGSSERSGEK